MIRRKLGLTFRCANCDYPYTVYLLPSGFIGLEKRNNRTKTLKNKQQLLEDIEYLDKLSKQKIRQVKKKFNQELFNEFINEGQFAWVIKARSIFVEEAYMLDISVNTISKYFKHHGGRIDERTVKTYINQTTT
jgi:hypothetical protein